VTRSTLSAPLASQATGTTTKDRGVTYCIRHFSLSSRDFRRGCSVITTLILAVHSLGASRLVRPMCAFVVNCRRQGKCLRAVELSFSPRETASSDVRELPVVHLASSVGFAVQTVVRSSRHLVSWTLTVTVLKCIQVCDRIPFVIVSLSDGKTEYVECVTFIKSCFSVSFAA
jgi:hypothetical protein